MRGFFLRSSRSMAGLSGAGDLAEAPFPDAVFSAVTSIVFWLWRCIPFLSVLVVRVLQDPDNLVAHPIQRRGVDVDTIQTHRRILETKFPVNPEREIIGNQLQAEACLDEVVVNGVNTGLLQ